MPELSVEQPRKHVRLLRMCRPARRNALSLAMIRALSEQVQIAAQEGDRAIVIASEGAVFSAGADFADLKGDLTDLEFDARMVELTQAIRRSGLISFAAIQGGCIGAGFDLAMACDFRVAAEEAFFGLPSIQMGILYNPESLSLILSSITPAVAKRMLLLGERIARDEAFASGVVTHCSQGQGEQSALNLAIALAANSVTLPFQAQVITKEFIGAVGRGDAGASVWQSKREALLVSDDRQAALMGKRK